MVSFNHTTACKLSNDQTMATVFFFSFWHDYKPNAKMLTNGRDATDVDENGNQVELFSSTL